MWDAEALLVVLLAEEIFSGTSLVAGVQLGGLSVEEGLPAVLLETNVELGGLAEEEPSQIPNLLWHPKPQ